MKTIVAIGAYLKKCGEGAGRWLDVWFDTPIQIGQDVREVRGVLYCRLQKIAFGLACGCVLFGILVYSRYPFIALIGFCVGISFLGLYLLFRGLTIFVYPASGHLFFNNVEELRIGSEKIEALLGWIMPGLVLFILFVCGAIYFVLQVV
jgi:hypothetical protein